MFTQTRNVLALAVAAMAVTACGGGSGDGSSNAGLMIGKIADVTVAQDTPATVPISVSGAQTSFTLSATSADNTLIPPSGINVQTSGTGTPTLNLMPAEDATGATVISVAAADSAGHMARQSFMLTVNAVNMSFTTFANGVFAKAEGDQPTQVSGFTFSQDADDSGTFNALVE